MEVKPEILQVLHRILRQKTDLDSQLVGGPRRVQICRNVESEATKNLEIAQQELKRLKLIAADKQLQLKMRETKLEDFKGKRNACSTRDFSLRRGFVEIGDGARRVDDENAAGARGLQRFVHGSSEFDHAARGGLAPVIVPHVADDDRGLRWFPLRAVFHDAAVGFRA